MNRTLGDETAGGSLQKVKFIFIFDTEKLDARELFSKEKEK